MRNALLLALALSACSPPASPGGDDMAPAPVDGQATPLDIEGRIVGLDRAPLPGVRVSLCQATCREATTGAQGEYAFPGVIPAFYTLRARMPGASDRADLDFPLYLERGANPRLLPLVLPRVGDGAPVPAGEGPFAVDAALTLSIDGGKLALPQGGRPTRLGGVRIPQDLYPNFCVPSARVLAMWAFSPTGVTSPAAIGVTLSEGLGLQANAVVRFIEIDPADGRPAVAASGSVSGDGKSIQTAAGTGLRRLSWLLLAVLQGGP